MKKNIIILILINIILSFGYTSFASQIIENTTVETYSDVSEPNIDDLTIYSDCILLVEKETGDVLYEKNAYEKMYPASTTKTLSAILVLENCSLDEIATASSVAVRSVPSSYTTANLQIR